MYARSNKQTNNWLLLTQGRQTTDNRQHHNITTAQQHNSTTAQQHNSTTAQQHNSTTALPAAHDVFACSVLWQLPACVFMPVRCVTHWRPFSGTCACVWFGSCLSICVHFGAATTRARPGGRPPVFPTAPSNGQPAYQCCLSNFSWTPPWGQPGRCRRLHTACTMPTMPKRTMAVINRQAAVIAMR